MKLLKRLLTAIDERLDHEVRLHIARAIPEPRRAGIERIGCWDHCGCCRITCDDLHRTPCPDHQLGGA